MAVAYGTIAIVPKGPWNAGTEYNVGNLVELDGSSYVAKAKPPAGTLPTDTNYWQVSATGTSKATANSAGVVKPDGVTTEVDENAALFVRTAQQDAVGVVKGSAGINVGKDGSLDVNTDYKQATTLANIIAGEAIAQVLGKVAKAIATTMNLDQNALLKNMLTGIDVNDSNKVPNMALIHTLIERIGMGTDLTSDYGNLTAAVNSVNQATKQLNSDLAPIRVETKNVVFDSNYISSVHQFDIFRNNFMAIISGRVIFTGTILSNTTAIKNLPLSMRPTNCIIGSYGNGEQGEVMSIVSGNTFNMAGNPTANREYRFQCVGFLN